MDLSWLFEDQGLTKGVPIKRIVDAQETMKPDTSEYRRKNGLEDKLVSTDMGLTAEPMVAELNRFNESGESDDRGELADDADVRLQEALKHLEGDVRVYDALKILIEELDKKNDEYHEKHPTPEDEAAQRVDSMDSLDTSITAKRINPKRDLTPITNEWLKEIMKETMAERMSRKIDPEDPRKIQRCGTAPTEENPLVREILYYAKALKEGASLDEIKDADRLMERVFGSSRPGVIRRLF